jgi:LacI family transcriptional regulator
MVIQGRAIHELGLVIPEDIAVASFEHPDVIDALSPRPTTLGKIEADIGAAAASMLLSLIDRKETDFPRETIIPGELIIGGSCGCTAPNN